MAAIPLKRQSDGETDAIERRRWRRVPIALSGRMLDASGRELACRTQDVSAGGARLHVMGRPAWGRSVVHLDGLGRLAGDLVWTGAPYAAVRFEATENKRERLVDELTWRLNERALGLVAERPPTRTIPDRERALAQPDDGDPFEVRVIDMNLAAATLACAETPPAIGTWVRIGMSWGKVSARSATGFSVDFAPR